MSILSDTMSCFSDYVQFVLSDAMESINSSHRWGWGTPYDHAAMKILYTIGEARAYKERLLFMR